jgi:ATP-binding cassette subfamily F protein uup
MLDRVSTVVLGLDGLGGVERFGDYSQWDVWQRAQQAKSARSVSAVAPRSPSSPEGAPPAGAKRKLSYLEAREFVAMETRIAEAEQELGVLRAALEDPTVMSDAPRLQVTCAQIEEAQKKVDMLYARWAELEQKQG